MAVEVYLPKMSDHMESGTLLRWLVQEGETVQPGQVLLEIETDKAVGEIEAQAGGILSGIRASAGDVVPVGEPLAFIVTSGEQVPHLPPLVIPPSPSSVLPTSPSSAISKDSQPVLATPVARRVAKELGVDLTQVTGTGPGGRIREEDVRRTGEKETGPVPGEKQPTGSSVPLTSVQRQTGLKMVESARLIPQFFLEMDIDMTRALVRQQQAGKRLTITALIAKAVASTLKNHPRLNALFEGDSVRLLDQIHLGVAIGTDEGLYVPVIKDADQKTIIQISDEIKTFQTCATEKRFALQDLFGATFTISNLGMHGVDRFDALINPPQCAILAVGRITSRPVGLDDGRVGLRSMMTLTLGVDHRAVDGLQAARFMDELKKVLESL